MMKPTVTVLIDTYNHERFIEEAIVSVLEQDFPRDDMEILVVDDGSTDRTPEIVRKFEPRVRLLRKANGGQASAFNAGIPECQGEIIAFLDGDDWWVPLKLRMVVAQLEANPEVGAVGHGLYESYSDVRPPRSVVTERACRVHLSDPATARLFTQLRACLGTSRITIRRTLLEQILPFPEQLVIEADEWMFTLAPALAPVVVLNQPLVFYRLHDGNLYQFSNADRAKARRKRAVLEVLLQLLPLRLRELGVSDEVIATVVEPIWVDAERIRLWLGGGKPWQTFRVERASYRYRYHHSHVTFGCRLFNAMVLALALALPPCLFYRLRQWYSDNNLRKLRRIVGEPSTDAPILEQRPEP
jgi:glycosyltransferase involved in cell wall biosynthesis